MKIERLRNKKSKLIFLCGFLVVVVLLITVVFKGSKAKYRNNQIVPLITNKKVTNNVPDFTVMGIYLNDGGPITGKDGKRYTKQDKNFPMPSEGYVINEANSYCQKFNSDTNSSKDDTNVKLYTDKLGNHLFKGLSQGDKCHLFFDIAPMTIMKLLRYWGYTDITEITERTDFGTVRLDGGNKVYKAPDNYGTSYYFVGNPSNNWVKFAGFYWRIVRINGNGSLRLIYQGTAANTTTNTNLESTNYNSGRDNGYYVGYMYSEETRIGFGTDSNIKTKLDTFYTNKLASYDSKIDKNAGFCNDRSVVGGDGYGSGTSYFGSSSRLYVNPVPQLFCPEPTNNLFTVNNTDLENRGNRKLTKPIGLITADEVAMGGLVYKSTPSSRKANMYDTEQFYWTMTPILHMSSFSRVWFVYSGGYYGDDNDIAGVYGVRPVINLVKDITFSKGNGSISNPFEI